MEGPLFEKPASHLAKVLNQGRYRDFQLRAIGRGVADDKTADLGRPKEIARERVAQNALLRELRTHIFGVDVWICDLAAHDPTYILPILMGISMFMQQKMSPTSADPRQAKMMLVMPVVFTFMFVNLPAGLVLYWTVSNVLQILQQMFMDRHSRPAATAGREAKDAARS